MNGRWREVRRVINAEPDDVYACVTDVELTAEASDEVVHIEWLTRHAPDEVRAGDCFRAHNRFGELRWTSTSTVVEADRPSVFAFVVGDLQNPTATWTYRIDPVRRGSGSGNNVVSNIGSEVHYRVDLGDGPSMFDVVATDGNRAQVEQGRLDLLAASMRRTLEHVAETLWGRQSSGVEAR